MGTYVHAAMHVDFNTSSRAERDLSKAKRAPRPALQIRRMEIGSTRFACVSAHQLLDAISDGDRARPGHPLG